MGQREGRAAGTQELKLFTWDEVPRVWRCTKTGAAPAHSCLMGMGSNTLMVLQDCCRLDPRVSTPTTGAGLHGSSQEVVGRAGAAGPLLWVSSGHYGVNVAGGLTLNAGRVPQENMFVSVNAECVFCL